jgi:hypothetical protein
MNLDRLGARRQIRDWDELDADARMGCLGDRSEGRDETIGRAARRPNRHTEIGMGRPEIDRRDERRRDDQKARGQN